VIANSDVAKRTFYKHFSKDKLILEVMLYREKQWLWFEESIAQRGKLLRINYWQLLMC